MNILNLYEYVHSNVEIQIHSFLPYKTWVGFPSSHRAGTLEPGGTEHLCSSRAVLSERSCVGSRGREKWSRWKQRTDNDYRSKARFWLLIPRERADGEIPESQGFSCPLCPSVGFLPQLNFYNPDILYVFPVWIPRTVSASLYVRVKSPFQTFIFLK